MAASSNETGTDCPLPRAWAEVGRFRPGGALEAQFPEMAQRVLARGNVLGFT